MLRLCFMPRYSREFNTDELLNQDTKQAIRPQRPHDQSQMIATARSHLHRCRQRQPGVVQSFFDEESVQYKAVAG